MVLLSLVYPVLTRESYPYLNRQRLVKKYNDEEHVKSSLKDMNLKPTSKTSTVTYNGGKISLNGGWKSKFSLWGWFIRQSKNRAMKRAVICLASVIVIYSITGNLFVLVGAAFTSKASGDWDAAGQTTWNEINFPVSGDTVQINNTHVIRVDAGTGNEACYTIDLLSGGGFVIDSEGGGALSFTFDDTAGAGFSATTADVVTTIGTVGNIVTLTSAGAPPAAAANYWYGPREVSGAGFDMAYTTVNYFRSFTARTAIAKAVNVDFLNSSVFGQALRIRDASAPSEFTNVTITGTVTWGIYITGINPTLFTNLDLSGGNFNEEFRFGWSGEFVNCSFDITNVAWLGSNNRKFISKDHNDVSGAYGIVMDDSVATLDKSTITLDFTSTDNVTIYIGELICDEATAHRDMTIKNGGTLNVDPNITQTITNTGTITIDIGGTIDWTGGIGNLITLVSDNPGTQWSLINNGTVTVAFVDVTDSDASGGSEIDATDGGSVDNGNNDNWDFGAADIVLFRRRMEGE